LKTLGVEYIVGWVEVTKPFGYAVPERLPWAKSKGSRRAGQRPTDQGLCVGLDDRNRQPTNTKYKNVGYK